MDVLPGITSIYSKLPTDLVIINNFNDIEFYQTVVKALKWEHGRLHLIQTIRNLKLCDVVEDIEFSQL